MNTTANNTNTTTSTSTNAAGQTVHTATLNTLPVTAAPLSIADRLKAKLNKGKATADKSANPITPKVMFEQLDQPGTVTAFIEAALNGEDKAPLVILASHVNRSECLKAAHAAIKFADLAAKYAPTYGLTAPEFTRLLAKLIIQDYNPATLEAETETTAPEPKQETPEVIAAPGTIGPAIAAHLIPEEKTAPEPKQEAAPILDTTPTAKPKKSTHKA